MAEDFRYWAFVSYSHADREWAEWLHRGLERRPIPKTLRGRAAPGGGGTPGRLFPVFLGREEPGDSDELGREVEHSLRRSRFLIVICSPQAAGSPRIEREIIEFKRLHGEQRVLGLIVAGEPWASDGKPGLDEEDECFPRALRQRVGEDGRVSKARCEPIAADARAHGDGREFALMKLVARMLGVGFDELRRREEAFLRQRIRRLRALVGVFALAFVLAALAGTHAYFQKREVGRALGQADLRLAVLARDEDEIPRAASYLARSLRADPRNPATAIAAHSLLAHRHWPVPVGPVLRHPAAVSGALRPQDDGAVITAAGSEVFRWSRETFQRLARHEADGSAVVAMAESPDGRLLAVATETGGIHLLDSRSLDPAGPPWRLHASRPRALAWQPQGDGLALTLDGGKGPAALVFLDAAGAMRDRVPLPNSSARRLVWSPDGRRVAVGGEGPAHYLIGWERGRWAEPLALENTLLVADLAFLPSGRLRVVEGVDGWVERDPVSGARLAGEMTLAATLGRLSPGGTWLLRYGSGRDVTLWHLESGSRVGEPFHAAFTPRGAEFLGGEEILIHGGPFAQLVRLRSPKPLGAPLPLRHLAPDLLALAPDGATLAAASSGDPRVAFLDLKSLAPAARPVDFPDGVRAISFSADGASLLALGTDGALRSIPWRAALRVGIVGSAPPEPPAAEARAAFSPDGRWLALAGEGSLRLMDTASGEVRAVAEIEEAPRDLVWQPRGEALSLLSGNDRLRSFRWRGGRLAQIGDFFAGERVMHLAAAPEGGVLGLSFTSNRLAAWNPRDGRTRGAKIPLPLILDRFVWHADGRSWIAAGDGRLGIWDSVSGLETGRLPLAPSASAALFRADAARALLVADGPFVHLQPLASTATPPGWLPDLLEALAGSSVEADGGTRAVGPDAWIRPLARARAEGGPWGELADWLFATRDGRAAAPGLAITENQAAERLALPAAWQALDAKRIRWQDQLETHGESYLPELRRLLDTAIRDHPADRDLRFARLSLAAYEDDPAAVRDSFLGLAASPESSLVQVHEALAEAARAALMTEPPDRAEALRLLDQVLAADPEHPAALELSAEITSP